MPDTRWMNKLGATPGKLAVVGLLAAAMIVVLLFPVGGSSAPESTSHRLRTARKPAPVAPSTAAPVHKPAVAQAPAPSHPTIRLAEVIRHDPFAPVPALVRLSAAHSQAAAGVRPGHARHDEQRQRIQQSLAALQSKGVQMVLLGGREKMAVVGDRPVRVGDVVDGLRVTSITARGITLSGDHNTRE